MNNLKTFGQFIAESLENDGEWYYGIADCKGLESFMQAPSETDTSDTLFDMGLISQEEMDRNTKGFNQTLNLMTLRCQYNVQRHPVVYMAKLSQSDADEVQGLMDNGDYVEALLYLKDSAIEVKLARGRGYNAEKAWNRIPNPDLDPMSESLAYHINEGISVAESVYRPASQAHFELLAEARTAYDRGEIELSGIDQTLFEETDLGKFAQFNGEIVPLDFLFEAEYNGKKVELGKPMRGGQKKYYVYVMNPKTKRVKKIAFGDVHGGLKARVSDPKARKSFAARHQCHLKNDRTKAGYWACRINRYAHLWGGKTYPGFW